MESDAGKPLHTGGWNRLKNLAGWGAFSAAPDTSFNSGIIRERPILLTPVRAGGNLEIGQPSRLRKEETMFRSIGPWEIGLILLIILIVFGVGKLPQVGGAIGRALREFRKSQKGEDDAKATKPDEAGDDKPQEPKS